MLASKRKSSIFPKVFPQPMKKRSNLRKILTLFCRSPITCQTLALGTLQEDFRQGRPGDGHSAAWRLIVENGSIMINI
jgi:hypothetical protein